jgi:hypothetical protein
VRVGGQRHASDALPPGKTRYPLYRRLGGLQGWSGRVRKISPPTRFDPRTVHPVAFRTTFKWRGYRHWHQWENINVYVRGQGAFYWETTKTSVYYVKRHSAAVARSVVSDTGSWACFRCLSHWRSSLSFMPHVRKVQHMLNTSTGDSVSRSIP